MEFAYNIGGGAPHIKKFMVANTSGTTSTTIGAGVPIQSNQENDNANGVIAATSAVCVGCVGLSVDSATSYEAIQTTGDNAGFVSVIINPDACFRAKMSGSSAEDATLVVVSTAQAAASAGEVITAGTDEFMVWGYTGANAGHVRRMTAAAEISGVAMPYAIAAGDRFVQTSLVVAEATQWPELTASFTQLNAQVAVDADDDNFTVVELLLRDSSDDGLTNSYAIIIPASHAFGQVGTLAT